MVGILGGAIGGASVNIIIRAVDAYSKEFNKATRTVKNQDSIFKRLGKTLSVTGIGYAALAGAVVGFGIDAVKTAIEAETAFQQFNLAMGDTADIMLKDMRKASKGMISDLDLVKNANAALALGISRNQIPELLEVATARAKVFGRTGAQAFNDLAIGIGRQSRLILDNLGIILDLDKTYSDYAKTVGKTVEELSELDKKMALTTGIIEQSSSLVKANIFLEQTHAERIQVVSSMYDNAKSAIGGYLLQLAEEALLLDELQQMRRDEIDSVTGIKGTYEAVSETIIQLNNAQRELTEELNASNNEAQNLIDTLLNLKDVRFTGERAGSLEIAKQKEAIRILKLREAQGEEVAKQLEEEENQLEILRLKQDEFANKRQIQEAQNALDLEKINELQAVGFSEFEQGQQNNINSLVDLRAKQEGIRQKIVEIQEAEGDLLKVFDAVQQDKTEGYHEEVTNIDGVIRKTQDLTASYIRAAEARREAGVGSAGGISPGLKAAARIVTRGLIGPRLPGGSFFSVGDAILRPNGDVIKTHPQDTLIATKNPGGMGVVINIGTIQGVDAEQISKALSNELSTKVSL